jgi:hypothetical protein
MIRRKGREGQERVEDRGRRRKYISRDNSTTSSSSSILAGSSVFKPHIVHIQ